MLNVGDMINIQYDRKLSNLTKASKKEPNVLSVNEKYYQ